MLQQWATEVFRASGNRRHVIGIHASGFNIRFYFYDRAGVIYTRILDIEQDEDAALFVRAVLRLTMASPFVLGLDPFFAPSPRTPFHHPVSQLPLHLSHPSTSLTQTEGAVIRVEGVDFIVEDLIMSAGSLYGRGTTIFGVRPIGSPSRPELPCSPSFHDCGSQGKHHRCHLHEFLPQTLPPLDGRLILKLAWQVPSRQSEDKLLQLAQEKGVENLIRLYKSTTLERLSKGFRGKLVPKKMYVDRELRIQVLGPRCIPLKRIGNIEDFKEAFRSLVRGQLSPQAVIYKAND